MHYKKQNYKNNLHYNDEKISKEQGYVPLAVEDIDQKDVVEIELFYKSSKGEVSDE